MQEPVVQNDYWNIREIIRTMAQSGPVYWRYLHNTRPRRQPRNDRLYSHRRYAATEKKDKTAAPPQSSYTQIPRTSIPVGESHLLVCCQQFLDSIDVFVLTRSHQRCSYSTLGVRCRHGNVRRTCCTWPLVHHGDTSDVIYTLRRSPRHAISVQLVNVSAHRPISAFKTGNRWHS